MRYARLFVLRGLPGSGKTSTARELVNEAIETLGVTRVSRDDFRTMFHGGRLGVGRQEQMVTVAMNAVIGKLLDLGTDVIVDSTNLRDSDIFAFEKIAAAHNARVHVLDLRDVPVTECIHRDSLRQGAAQVGADVIRGMFEEHIEKGVTARATRAVRRARATARA
jgi:predicted kinase